MGSWPLAPFLLMMSLDPVVGASAQWQQFQEPPGSSVLILANVLSV